MEVVSPDDPNRDIVTKRVEYAQAGIGIGLWIRLRTFLFWASKMGACRNASCWQGWTLYSILPLDLRWTFGRFQCTELIDILETENMNIVMQFKLSVIKRNTEPSSTISQAYCNWPQPKTLQFQCLTQVEQTGQK